MQQLLLLLARSVLAAAVAGAAAAGAAALQEAQQQQCLTVGVKGRRIWWGWTKRDGRYRACATRWVGFSRGAGWQLRALLCRGQGQVVGTALPSTCVVALPLLVPGLLGGSLPP